VEAGTCNAEVLTRNTLQYKDMPFNLWGSSKGTREPELEYPASSSISCPSYSAPEARSCVSMYRHVILDSMPPRRL